MAQLNITLNEDILKELIVKRAPSGHLAGTYMDMSRGLHWTIIRARIWTLQ